MKSLEPNSWAQILALILQLNCPWISHLNSSVPQFLHQQNEGKTEPSMQCHWKGYPSPCEAFTMFLAQGKRSPDLLDIIIILCPISTSKTSFIITKPEIIYVQNMGISTIIPSKNYRVNKEDVLFSTKQSGLLHESRNKSSNLLHVNLISLEPFPRGDWPGWVRPQEGWDLLGLVSGLPTCPGWGRTTLSPAAPQPKSTKCPQLFPAVPS